MKIFDLIEIKPQEVLDLISRPFQSILKTKIITESRVNSIIWEYQLPRFKSRRGIRKEDISDIRPLCRKCRCELRNDFSYPIERTTSRTFVFTCPSCRLVHGISVETPRDYFADLVRKLAYEAGKNEI